MQTKTINMFNCQTQCLSINIPKPESVKTKKLYYVFQKE